MRRAGGAEPTRGASRPVTLASLGDRICIMGPSNSGKSVLAGAISQMRALPVVYLDQLCHEPGTDWRPRPTDVFRRLHDEAVQRERWVMEGNYSALLPARLARATGLILLDAPTILSLSRYVRRTVWERDRVGGLDGGQDSVKWGMIRHIAVTTRANRRRYEVMFNELRLPKVRLASPEAMKRFFETNGLRPTRNGSPRRQIASSYPQDA